MILDETSLATTIDNLNDAWFYDKQLADDERRQVALWLAGRQGLKGSYQGMFAPTPRDFESPIRLFSGHVIKTGASKSHVLGEETLRALIKLNIKDETVERALKRGRRAMDSVIARDEKERKIEHLGFFCCPTCSSAYWRAMTVGALSKSKERLTAGMRILRQSRTGTGRWKRFPFFYTLMVLSEMDRDLSGEELKYAGMAIDRFLSRKPADDFYSRRRRDIAEKILSL